MDEIKNNDSYSISNEDLEKIAGGRRQFYDVEHDDLHEANIWMHQRVAELRESGREDLANSLSTNYNGYVYEWFCFVKDEPEGDDPVLFREFLRARHPEYF